MWICNPGKASFQLYNRLLWPSGTWRINGAVNWIWLTLFVAGQMSWNRTQFCSADGSRSICPKLLLQGWIKSHSKIELERIRHGSYSTFASTRMSFENQSLTSGQKLEILWITALSVLGENCCCP